MGNKNDQDDSDRTVAFIKLLGEHESKLGRYTMMLVPNSRDAVEILQDSKVVMWRSFDSFLPGTDFAAWARKVIFNQILKYRRQPSRRSIPFSEETLKLLEADAETFAENLDRRRAILATCVEKLPGDQKELVGLRYNDEYTVERIAESVGRTPGAVYRALSRIRKVLRDCVSLSLREEEKFGS